MERERNNFEQITPGLNRKLELVPKYLEQFGYDQQTIQLAEAVHNLIAERKLTQEVSRIYGELLTSYILDMKNAYDLRRAESVLRGALAPALHEQVRFAICIDYANHFSKKLTTPATTEFRFKLPLRQFNNCAMADLLRIAYTQELASVHKTFLEIAKDEEDRTLWENKYPIFEKSFQEKEEKPTTFRGVCMFHSETGTEGGYWAFQDENFTEIPDNTQNCAHCGYFKEFIESKNSINFTEKDRRPCPDGQHKWQLVFPEGKWSYEGLHILENGDELTIYDKGDKNNILWKGAIDLKQHPLFTTSALGMWIHADQKGIDRETWALLFFNDYPAKLVKKEKVQSS